MKKTKKIFNMIVNSDSKKKCFFLTYSRLLDDNTLIDDVSYYTKEQSKNIVNFFKIAQETNEDRKKLFSLENVIFDTVSKAKQDLRKISVKHTEASCRNSYSDITHKSFARYFNEFKQTSLFFADSEVAKKAMIADNRISEKEKTFSVYALQDLLKNKKAKKTKAKKTTAKKTTAKAK